MRTNAIWIKSHMILFKAGFWQENGKVKFNKDLQNRNPLHRCTGRVNATLSGKTRIQVVPVTPGDPLRRG